VERDEATGQRDGIASGVLETTDDVDDNDQEVVVVTPVMASVATHHKLPQKRVLGEDHR
jgi:hypothetical protein